MYSRSREKHEQHSRIVLQRLRDNRIYVKFLKKEYWIDYITFLRHVMSKDWIMVDPAKAEAIQVWARHKSPAIFHSFISLVA